MKKIEIALSIPCIISVKWCLLFLLPGGGLLVTLFFLIFSMFYFIFGFAIFNNIDFGNIFKRESYKNINFKEIFSGIFKGWFFSIAIMGILFKIMSWTGAEFNLIIGIVGFIVLLILLVIKNKNSKKIYKSVDFRRLVLISIISMIFLAIPTNAMIRFKYRNYPDYVKAKIKAKSNPENLQYQKEFERQSNITFPE